MEFKRLQSGFLLPASYIEEPFCAYSIEVGPRIVLRYATPHLHALCNSSSSVRPVSTPPCDCTQARQCMHVVGTL